GIVAYESPSSPPAFKVVHINSMAGSKGQPSESGSVVSNLSVNAAEIYPSGYSAESNNYVDENGVTLMSLNPHWLNTSRIFLNHLPEQPGSFEAEIYQIDDVLNNWVTTDELLQELVGLIYQQATAVKNFSYTGARLCNCILLNFQQSVQGRSFRQLLLKRCQTEFDKRDQRFHAFVLFLGELYLNLEIKGPEGQLTRVEILKSGLKELVDALFAIPVDDNLICAVKRLKLTGSVLEDAWKEKGAPYMDEVMQRMKNVVLDAQCSRDVKLMLLKLVELQSSNWGRVQDASTFREATPENDQNYLMNEPMFYTSEGVPFTAADPDYQEKYQALLDREDFFPDYEENGTDFPGSGLREVCLESERKKTMNP
uniref:Polyadenylate-binding protein-interacting protein 1 n=1 Tax=Leptobrachium leishanense TaxID=445787 RepID=A0A8C5MDF9_9ANUR